MKRIALLTVLLLIGSLGTIAKADTVVYSTGTDLTIAPTTDTSFFLSTNLAFVGIANSVDEPTNASLGSFVITGPLANGKSTFTDVNFTLDIFQLIPSIGTGDLLGSISGVIKEDSSTASVTFDETSIQIGSVIYTLTGYTLVGGLPSYTLNADSNDGVDPGTTSINAEITETPEPGSLLLLGSGLLSLAMLVFWKGKASRLVLHS
jgi:hypothetical protein